MKKVVTIVIIVILALGFGWYLFKISGGTQGTAPAGNDFDLSNIQPTDKLREVSAADHILGNPEAKNTMIAFEDLQCPACANYEPTLISFATELKDTKVVFRHFPLTTIHRNATAAAYASEAAAAQGKFWEFVKLVYERQSRWSGERNPTESFVEIARDAGVADLEKFRNETENKTYRNKVQDDIREAAALGVSGTPTLYFNGVKLELAGLEGIKQMVNNLYK